MDRFHVVPPYGQPLALKVVSHETDTQDTVPDKSPTSWELLTVTVPPAR